MAGQINSGTDVEDRRRWTDLGLRPAQHPAECDRRCMSVRAQSTTLSDERDLIICRATFVVISNGRELSRMADDPGLSDSKRLSGGPTLSSANTSSAMT